MFNKRHYEAIAKTLQDIVLSNDELDDEQLAEVDAIRQGIINDFAILFVSDNGRFQLERFVAACQPGANVKLRTRYKLPSAKAILPAPECAQ